MRDCLSRTPRPGVRALLLLVLTGALVAAGAAPAYAAAEDTEPPSTPGPITVAEITTTSVLLTWAASTDNVGVVGYDVSRFYSDVVVLHSTPTNSIRIDRLRPSWTYSFSVRAWDAAGNGSPSPARLRLNMPPGDDQPPTVPGRPVAAAVTDTSVTLFWMGSTDDVSLNRYEVLRITPDGNDVVATAPQHPPTGPTVQVRGLTPGTTYTLAVRAVDDAGNVSALSDPLTVTTTGRSEPEPAPVCSVRDAGYNAVVAPNETATLAYAISSTIPAVPPSAFWVNGHPCLVV